MDKELIEYDLNFYENKLKKWKDRELTDKEKTDLFKYEYDSLKNSNDHLDQQMIIGLEKFLSNHPEYEIK